MASDGSEFSLDLVTTGGSAAQSLADTADSLAAKLGLAQSAAASASDAMKLGQTAYDQAERSAMKASLAVEKIGLSLAAQTAKATEAANEYGVFSTQYQSASSKLDKLTASQSAASEKSEAAKAALLDQAKALDALKASAAGAVDAETKASNALEQATNAQDKNSEATKDGTGNSRALASAFGKLGGPLGGLGQMFFGARGAVEKMGKALGDKGPYAVAAIAAAAAVAAIAALAIAAVTATVKIAAWGVGLADAARSHVMLAQGMTQSVAGGAALSAQMDSLADKVPLSRDEITGLAGDLIKTGLKGQQLSDALETAATKAAKLKFGPDFEKQMNSLPALAARLQGNFSKIFGGLKIEPLLAAFRSLVGLFDANSASANAIKVVFESLFQPLIDGTTDFIPKVRTAFIQFEIYALQALIAIKPFWSSIKLGAEIFGVLAASVVVMGAVLLAAALIPLGLLAAAFAIVSTAVIGLVAGFVWLGVQIYSGVGTAITWLTDAFHGVIDFLSGLSLESIGTALIDGLIKGITDAGSGVLSAITGIADGAVSAAKKALGIASPSKVFAEIGMHTAAGMEEGVDGGAGGVQDSVEAMTEAPDAAKSGAASGSGGSGSAGNIYYVTVNGGGDAESNREAFSSWLEGMGFTFGGGVPDAA